MTWVQHKLRQFESKYHDESPTLVPWNCTWLIMTTVMGQYANSSLQDHNPMHTRVSPTEDNGIYFWARLGCKLCGDQAQRVRFMFNYKRNNILLLLFFRKWLNKYRCAHREEHSQGSFTIRRKKSSWDYLNPVMKDQIYLLSFTNSLVWKIPRTQTHLESHLIFLWWNVWMVWKTSKSLSLSCLHTIKQKSPKIAGCDADHLMCHSIQEPCT